MRVVLDTNVLISGIFFQGIPGQIVDAWIDGKYTLFCAPSILEEYGKVMHEFTADKDPLTTIDWFTTLYGLSHLIPDPIVTVRYSRDIHDDKFISCALNAKADYLVTGDKDLIVLPNKFSFEIVSPRKFLSYLLKAR